MQEDKEAIFDAIDNVKLCLKTCIPMIQTMKPYTENMRNAAAKGFINATDCADYLVKKGMPFRDAYKLTGTLVAYCIENNLTLETLPIEKYKEMTDLFTEDIYNAISLDTCVGERKSYGGPAPDAVKVQIEFVENQIAELEKVKIGE
jgi:argininosuccinate lyase